MDKNRLEKMIQEGKVGVMATDTIYGLVGSALKKKVVERIYRLKQRDSSKPLIVLIGDIEDLKIFNIETTVEITKILKKYWPGPTSIVMVCAGKNFEYLHRGAESVAFRLPKKNDLRELLKKTGPIVAPSANIENKPVAKNINEAKNYFQEKVDFYIDEGELNQKPSKLIKIEGGIEEVIRV